jgi:RND family efflux transporter MFP subunit
MANHENNNNPHGTPGQPKKVGRNILRLIISLVLIAAGIGGARFLIATKPTVNKRPPVKMEPLVSTVTLQPVDYILNIPAMGNVIPAREISLETQVAGEVIYLHPDFTEGGMLAEGVKIVQINPKDYELAIMQKQRALSDAEYSLKLEQGHQDVARKEWDLLYGDQKINEAESELALRKPHLEKVQVEIEAARAELEQAKINLERTTLAAPFNVLVLNKYVDLGSQVTSQERLADLVGTDIFWVQVPLPIERLQWVQIPNGQNETGSRVKIIYREDNVREGRVIRLLPDLSKEGRMARLLIEVKDPLDLQAKGEKRPMLLIGEYVRVLIEGEQLHDVYNIPRSALHNDSEVWIADEENRLAIRPVKTIWRDEESVILQDGFKPGERLIVSGLAAPVAGMPLRIEAPEEPRQETGEQLQESK